jgi:cob(I)alamin adenosyltransferase
MRKGYIQVYTGNGKGKTTAALGLALRACGAGWRVLIGQFIKARETGEIRFIRNNLPGITIEQYGRGMLRGTISPEDRAAALRGLDRLRERMLDGDYDLVVADEINVAIAKGLLPLEDVLDLIRSKPTQVELVLTGRDAHPGILECADLVTEMRCIKHYLANGVPAREGIEW